MANTKVITPNQQVAITISLPNPSVVAAKAFKKASELFSVIYNPLRKSVTESASYAEGVIKKNSGFSEKLNSLKKFNKKKLLKIAFPVVGVLVAIIAIVAIVKNLPDAQSTPSTASSVNGVQTQEAIAVQNIDKLMNFPLKDANAKEVGKFEYTIQNAELRRQIVVQGRNATAVSGRVFLIFNLKVKNSLDKALQINTRDYLRITLAGNPSEKLAADIHNDPVEVQAISTKYTRVGLAIDEKDAHKPIELQIGEIGGTKQTITLNFKFK